MAEFENNKDTQLVEDDLASFEYNYGDVPEKEYFEKLNEVTTFYDYTFAYAQKRGYKGDKSDANSLSKFVYELGNVNGAPLISLATLKNWLKVAPPSGNELGRENVYRLCFALELTERQTKEFFLKAYLERPFNYKKISESVYFFCMKNGLGYSDAKRIIEKIDSSPFIENNDAETVTEQIGYAVSHISAEDDLITYLVNNRSGFTVHNKTATAKIKELIEECKLLANEESNRFDLGEPNVNSIDELLSVIMGYNARAVENGEKVYKSSISKSKLPDLVKRNFPQREQFKQIDKGEATFDTIRKALILLKFYSFFADALLSNAKELENGLFYEFVDETNEMLLECGYVQLYWRNPYDWLFAYCAYGASNPLDPFRDVIEEYYLKYLDSSEE